jgi:hypothetical protein
MKHLLFILFGHKSVTNISRTETEFKSTYPSNRPSLQEWMNEFKLGMLYDRKIIYID